MSSRRAPVVTPWRAAAGAVAVFAGMLACSGIITGPDAPDTRPRSMRIAPAQMQLGLADTARLTATLYDVTGAAAAVEPGQHLRYVSLDTGIARVDSVTGLVTALSDGTVTVRAEYGALTLGIPVTVLARPRLTVVSGDAQVAEQGDTLPLPVRVRALDALDQPVVGVAVTFAVSAGAGSFATASDTTDIAGNAESRWVLGLPLGAQAAVVTAAGYDSVTFAATATAGTRPARVAITSSRDTLTGVGDTTRMTAAVFNVADVALPGATVAWTTSALAVATVSPTGLVTAVAPGSAYIGAISGTARDSVLITVTGVAHIEIVSGDAQVVRWGQVAPDSLRFRLINASGNPVGDAFVAFTVSANGGTASPASETTDNDGYVATSWQAGDSLGAFTVTASRNGYMSAVMTGTVVAGTFVTRVQITAPRTELTGSADSEQFSAAAYNVADSLIPSAVITWQSRSPAVATVDATGLVAADAVGQSWIVASSDGGIDSVLVTVASPPVCDIGFGGGTVSGAPATVGGSFCPQRSIPPGAPNGAGNVSVFWFETHDYGGGAYFESLYVSYHATTGVIAEATYHLTDPVTLATWGCSPLPFAPPPCTAVSVDLLAQTITFSSAVLGTGNPVTISGVFPIPPQPVPVIGVVPDSLAFTAVVGASTGAAQTVTVSNIGEGTLNGLEATVLYDAGASDWLFASLDANVPATLTVTPQPEFLAAGAYRALIEITSSVPGVLPETVVVTMSVTAPAVVGLVKVSGDSQSVTVGAPLAAPLVVQLTDAVGAPVVGAAMRWQAIYGCCNPVVDTTTVTDGSGLATLSFTMPTVALPVTVTVSSTGQPGSPQLFSLTSVPDQGVALAFTLNTGGGAAGAPILPGWRIVARDQYSNVDTSFTQPITVELTNGPVGIATLGGTTTKNAVNGVADFDDLTVNVGSSSWVLVATSPGLTSSQSAAFSISVPVTLTLVNTPLIPLGGTATIQAVTSVPSYGSGLVVGLTSSDPSIVAVSPPATVTLPPGDSIVTFTVTGVNVGTTFINATVDGAGAGQFSVTVSTNTISVPLTLNLPYTRTASLPINLPAPAGAGGITINISSGDPSIVGVLTPTVFIPQGGVSGNAQLSGLVLGQAAVTATGPSLATGVSTVTVTAALDLIETSVTMNAGFSTASLTTRLLSGGAVFPAPTGGIPLTFTSRNAACVAAPVNVSVAAGLNSVTTIADFGGSASTPCVTWLVVSAPSFDVDSVQVTVNPPPTTSLSLTANVAAGLSRDGILFLGVASPAGGTTVTITSSDPTKLVVAPNSSTVGAASAQINIAPGAGYTYFTYAAIEGQTGTAVLSATATNYQAPTPATITLDSLGVEASGTTSFTMPGADGGGTVYVGSLGPAGPSQGVSGSTIVRAGGTPIVVTLTSTTPSAAVPVVGGIAASPATVTINPGQSSASYGLRPLAAGTTTITATSPNAVSPIRPSYPATITVTQASTSFSVTANVAAGLSRDGILFLGAAAPPGGTVVTITSSDPARLVVAPNATTVGTASIDVTIPAGSGYTYFTYAAIEGQAGAAPVNLSGSVQGAPPAYSNPTPVAITIDTLGIEASGTTTFTMPGADGGGTVYVGSLGPAGPSQGVSGSTIVRAGGTPIVVTLTSTTPAAVVPVVGGIAASPSTVTINPGQSSASYALRPLAAGTSTITATAPGATAPVRPSYPATITVTQASTSLSVTANVAAGLSRDGILFLGATSPPGGTVVTITSSDPARLVLAPNSTTVGTASIDVTIPAGSGYSYFTYAAIEGQAGAAPVTISGSVQGAPPAYSNPVPVAITIDTLGVEASGSTTLTTLGADGGGTVYVGSLGPAGPSQAVSGSTIVRAGGAPIEITLTSTSATVAVPVVGGVAASPRTVTIVPGQSSASYGLRPLVAGTTTITATSPSAAAPVRPNYPATITVTSPSSSISLASGVGAGLTVQGIVFLQVAAPAGGTTITLTSSDPTRLLLAPDATTSGTTQVSIAVPQGATYTYFTAMGLEDVTGNPTVTAQTPGYTDATASIAVQPIGVQWSGTTAITTLAPDGGGTVYIGIISGVVGNRTVSPSQPVRFGGVARTITMTSSNAAVALPVVGGVAQQDITVTILPGASSASVNVRPLAVGVATIAPSGPGLIEADAPGNPLAVTVTVPVMTLSVPTMSQGAGLSQDGIVFLQTAVPAGGRTLTLTSNDPTRLLLAPNASTTGASQITFDLAAGSGYTYFTVMGLEGMTGAATVTATMAGYRDTTFTFTVVQPAVTLDGPAPTRAISQGDVDFHAQVGVPSGAGVQAQVVRYGAPAALTVTLTSSAPTIGTLVVGGAESASQAVSIVAGQSSSSSLVAERPNFRPLAPGNTTITATIPGYLQQGNAIRTVSVSP